FCTELGDTKLLSNLKLFLPFSRIAFRFYYQETFDFVVSFSSIEHSGLGRFGDPLDPLGDLREMQKMRCLMKKNALLFLGLPIGVDKVFFNAHRFYGRIRLPMVLEGLNSSLFSMRQSLNYFQDLN
ncbi:unnamed protein product, partial [Gongylonema pulchrum]|uniref:RNA-dependent RNA polymerase n=1 Tax=Gongylonema pulchrum TaxID=637853 RepID=A0A183CVI7_9BILA